MILFASWRNFHIRYCISMQNSGAYNSVFDDFYTDMVCPILFFLIPSAEMTEHRICQTKWRPYQQTFLKPVSEPPWFFAISLTQTQKCCLVRLPWKLMLPARSTSIIYNGASVNHSTYSLHQNNTLSYSPINTTCIILAAFLNFDSWHFISKA